MTAPARPMAFPSSVTVPRGIGSVARQFTAVVLIGVVLALYLGAAAAVGSFIWRDVPRIVGGALSALSQGSYGPGW